MASVDASLRRLRTEWLDLLLLHRPDALVEPEEVARAFSDLTRAGKVRHFGVSNHTAGQIALLQEHLDQPLVVNQVELNLWHAGLVEQGLVFNTGAAAAGACAEGTLDYCRRHGILVQAYSPIAKGRPWAAEGADARDDIRLIARLASERGVSAEAIAVAWLLRHPAGIQPVTGTRTPARLRACCEADRVALTREEWYGLLVAARGEQLP
jgi:predicted oxidoreductase